ncbi:hypothetical protein IV203_009000 [Nitzschia inconspicua]|uniref:DUF6824 domain-containing protein n=1 Tax=Nitzschia inconspicua TaxID=303405 RepID=A0A9K3K601_9STRA|nr:hypothetical protein IV203_011220 [Nitzschia inconspicua]KAG7352952.1 hypothetical protein IV203_009000 [Nitzschia inconspicua]
MSEHEEISAGPPPGPDEVVSMTDVTDPRETDVLCGRGGAALRHPGNQTYRRLVNLNKGLYITCLKTEKLKISRSIVAAIREQKGRFLERDSKKGTWYDIGDKKAIEKTSQALREGQPKLRAKMVEMGQIPPDQPVNPIQQQMGNGVYAPRQTPSIGSIGSMGAGSVGSFSINPYGMHSHMGSMASTGSGNAMTQMPPPPCRTMSNNMNDEMAMLQRLSLTPSVPQSVPSWTPSINSMGTTTMDDAQFRAVRNRMRPLGNPRMSSFSNNEIGMHQSNMSLMSDISAFTGNGISDRQIENLLAYAETDRVGSMESMMRQHNNNMSRMASQLSALSNLDETPLSPPPMAQSLNVKDNSPSSGGSNRFDRRRFFAKMKNAPAGSNRNAGQSQPSVNDGMPDIHMVDSQFSLLSNLSGHGSKHHTMDYSAHGEAKENTKDTIGSEFIGVGSRRSLMSGLSRTSNHSDHFNPFSDMSKKISGMTNHSVRSVAMSEISGIEEEGDFAEDDMDEFSFDLPPSRAPTQP